MFAKQSRAGGLPGSDVSPAVGLVGLAGLAAWIALCREWPAVADALNLPGPHVRLVGPRVARVWQVRARLLEMLVAEELHLGRSV